MSTLDCVQLNQLFLVLFNSTIQQQQQQQQRNRRIENYRYINRGFMNNNNKMEKMVSLIVKLFIAGLFF